MIDIHSHILFGVDDGAGNAEDSLIMAETAAENGVKQMIMTCLLYTSPSPRDS